MASYPIRAFCVPALLCLWITRELTFLIAGAVLGLQILINYGLAWSQFKHIHGIQGDEDATPQVPPDLPTPFPIIGPILSILWDHGGFVRRIGMKPARIPMIGMTIYHFQDRQTLKKIFRHASLASAMTAYKFSIKGALGVKGAAYLPYLADDSGPFPKPHPRSYVPSHNRIDYITTSGFTRGLTGPGMMPTVTRFVKHLSSRLEDLPFSDEWTEVDDLAEFLRNIVGTSTITSLFGPTMTRLHPSFARDLWKFDNSLESFKLPSVMIPGTLRIRNSLVEKLKAWYQYARNHFHEDMISADGDGDPIWGSSLMRHRQDTILKIDGQDDDSLARVDLGLAWASVGNVVPSSICAAFHVFKDPALLARVRDATEKHTIQTTGAEIDIKALASDPLLLSVYAETLRLYIKVHSAFMSPHEDVTLGKWLLPKGGIAMISSEPAHMDATFWNTKNGKHPLHTFWADRFLVKDSDPSSGPILPEVRRTLSLNRDSVNEKDKPYFSTEGCEGSWIPYGGGHSMCPGRFLSKHVMTITSALIAQRFDIEILCDSIEWSSQRYGIGAQIFSSKLPFRIRKRQIEQQQ